MMDRRNLLLAAAAAPAGAVIVSPGRADGMIDASMSLARAAAAGAVVLSPGRHRVSRDTRFAKGLLLQPGAVLVVDQAVIEIDGFFDAARAPAFECVRGGRVRFGPGAIIEGYPEWWGARPGQPDADCLPALLACIEAAEITRLAAADYHISDTLRLHVPYRRVHGTGWYGAEPRSATRLLLTGAKAASASVVQVGPDTMPDTIGHFDFAIGIADLVLARTAPCIPPPGGEEAQAACGMVIRHAVHCRVDRVAAIESSIGFYIHDTVYTKLTDCFSQRSNPGVHSNHDVMRGFYLDGRRKGIFSGGNASLYLERCGVSGSHVSHFDATAFKASGAFCDIYIDRLETSNVPKGCVLDGARSPNPQNGNINCHIRDAVFDWCSVGVEIGSAPPGTTVALSDIYVSLSSGATAGIAVHDGAGQVAITGGEIHSGAVQGSLCIARQSGISCQGLRIRNSKRPVLLDTARGCDLQFSVNNVTESADSGAVMMTDCANSYLRPTLIGRTGAFGLGVDLAGNGNRRNEINCTGIDPAALAGANQRVVLRHNGVAVTARGDFGDSNLASGVIG